MDRRDFMKFLGLSSFSLFAASCGLKRTSEKLIPFLIPPDEGYIPGEPLFKLTICKECPANCMIEAKLYDKVYKGKRNFYPVKFEGYKEYPFTKGSLCLRGQASLQRTYSPLRLKEPVIKENGNFRKAEWDEIYNLIIKNLKNKNNYLLSGKISGTGKALIKEFSEKFGFKDLYFEFLSYSNIRKANEISFGIKDIPFYHVDKAEVLVTIGANLFESFLNPLVFARYFSERKFEWFHIEPHFSITGMNSDKRLRINPDTEIFLISYLLKNLLLKKNSRDYMDIIENFKEYDLKAVSEKTGLKKEDIKEIEVKIIEKKALLVPGDVSSMSENGLLLNLLINIFNYEKGNYDEIINFSNSYGYEDVSYPSEFLNSLVFASKNKNSVLFVNNINLFKYLDKDIVNSFLNSFKIKVLFTYFKDIDISPFDIVVPLSTFPEYQGDSESLKNVFVIQNKLMEKLHDTKSFEEFLFDLMKKEDKFNYENYEVYLDKKWEEIFGEKKGEFLEKGYVVFNKKVNVKLDKDSVKKEIKKLRIKNENYEKVLLITPSLRFFDGRSKEIMLLNEIPDPLSSISWGEFIYISEELAQEEGLKSGDEIRISLEDTQISLPVFVSKFLRKNIFVIDIAFYNEGFRISKNSNDFVIYKSIKKLEKTGKKINLPILSGSFNDYKRILKNGLDEEYERIKHKVEYKESLYPEHKHEKYSWAMVIDLDKCIGCSACVSACYIENNIPCTGYEEHLKGREMSWIRIEPYYEDGKLEFVPMLCQQCHNAPCEPVCPVSATFHNSEGLNVQVYNRCVGTRYCSNNCPYKVRRFNWFDWGEKTAPFIYWTEEMKLMLNPEISRRPKGVMEKCTFCIQRIRKAEDKAKDEGRDVKDGEVVPACMQTCPTKAIIFGNINDKESEVYKHSRKDTFRIFEELGVEPSIYYLRENKDEGEI